MKGFEKELKGAIEKLPLHEPKPTTWDSISLELDFRNDIAATAKQLPLNEPSDAVWTNIELHLNKGHRIYKTRNFVIALSAAASIAFIIGLYIMTRQSNNGTISVSEETVSEWRPSSIMENDTSTQNAIRFIEDQCRSKNYVCNIPGFDEKKLQLLEINDQINELDLVIQSSGGTPTIVKSRIKLENLRTRLVKDLLTQIAS